MRTSTQTLAAALDILAHDIQSDDGVANAAIAEAAARLREQDAMIIDCQQRLDAATKALDYYKKI